MDRCPTGGKSYKSRPVNATLSTAIWISRGPVRSKTTCWRPIKSSTATAGRMPLTQGRLDGQSGSKGAGKSFRALKERSSFVHTFPSASEWPSRVGAPPLCNRIFWPTISVLRPNGRIGREHLQRCRHRLSDEWEEAQNHCWLHPRVLRFVVQQAEVRIPFWPGWV